MHNFQPKQLFFLSGQLFLCPLQESERAMTPTVYFLHGRDSSPLSVKIQRLSAIATSLGWKVVAPDLSATKDPDLRVTLFLDIAEQKGAKSVIVGSSMGGYVALMASKVLKPDALLLLAPALNLDGYREAAPIPVAGETTIVHGWNDHLIDQATVFEFAADHLSTLHLVNDDHTLQQTLPFIESVFRSILNRCNRDLRKSRLAATL
jgi:predicted esterase YcpF (UPF0227 family)